MRPAGMTARRRRLLIALAVITVVVVAGMLMYRRLPESVSAPLFVLVVIVEVVVAPIPGGAIGYMGAASFGFWRAWPLLYIGNIIGTTLVFLLARRLGTPIFEENVTARTRARYNYILERHPLLLWLAYVIPIIPVDILSALAGLSTIRTRRFFLIAFSGFIIYTAIVAYVGAFLAQFIGVADALTVFGLLFLVALGWWLWRHPKRG